MPDITELAGGRVVLERRSPIAILTINRPEARNAFDLEMEAVIEDTLAALEREDGIWTTVLTGAGDVAFSAGWDLKSPVLDWEPHFGPNERYFSRVTKPIVAAINGYCTAGGLEMVLGTDIRVAADHASFGLGEVRWGLVPSGGGQVRLPRQIPWAVAMEILVTGRRISAERAFQVGLLNEVVPGPEVLPAALRWAEAICENGPLAVRTVKETAVRSLALESAFHFEYAVSERATKSEDVKEGVRAFAEKRKPVYRGR
jgi:enoyl-CoA hydratase